MSASVFVQFNCGGLFSGWDGIAWRLVRVASRAVLSYGAECSRWLLPIGARRRIKGIGKGLLLLIGRYRCLAVAFLWTVGSESGMVATLDDDGFRIGWKLACVFSQ